MCSVTTSTVLWCLYLGALVMVHAEDPYLFFDWKVTYGAISPLGVPQQGILVNGAFPGPVINCTTNNNIIVNVHNELDEPLLITWSGLQHRRNSWVDGTLGTMCPIQPGTNFTYKFQAKDQIGSFYYFPVTGLQKASGGMGGIQIHSRYLIPVPFDTPAKEFSFLIGDWHKNGHKSLKKLLDNGQPLGHADGIQINGMAGMVGGKNEPMINVEAGKTYRLRICNVGLKTSLNFRIQGHKMTLVEMEGSHTVQNVYDSLDVHVGQCMSVLITANQQPKEYYIVASSRFTKKPLMSVAVIHYTGGKAPASPELPAPAPEDDSGIAWSINQFRTFRWNLTASAARPNPQGSYHYGKIKISRTIRLANSKAHDNGKLKYAINGVSHIDSPTPLKLAEYYNVQDKVFQYNAMKDQPQSEAETKVVVTQNVLKANLNDFVEIVFENNEKSIQTWRLDGYSFFAVAVEAGKWTPEKRKNYNLLDAVSRNSIQVYPGSWTAVMTTLDNPGMWSLRSEMWERVYLGQQLYLSVTLPKGAKGDEYTPPENALMCGIVKGLPKPAHAGA